MVVERLYDLGASGEEAATRLLAATRLGNHFEPIFVLAESPKMLGELRRRLQAAAPLFTLLEPSAEILSELEELTRSASESGERRVLWVEPEEVVDIEAWKAALVALNRRRDWLQERAPWLMVLAGPLTEGPQNLVNLCARHAPDFSSISISLLVRKEPLPKIRWLHLSDFHFTAESWERRPSARALLEFLEGRKKEGWSPHFVFATGDFASQGKREEFDQAILFLRQLAKTLDLDLASHFFLVPGNHDVDRGAKKAAQDAVLADLYADGEGQQAKIAQVLGDSSTLKFLGGRLAEYYSFTERLLGPARRTQSDRPWRVDIRQVGGVDVAILQLNSAWASGAGEEKGKLLVGAYQLEDALAEAATARVRIALLHHPADYLADGDAARLRTLLTHRRKGAHILLRGHLHENDSYQRVSPDGQLVELAAGTLYQDSRWPKRFLIAELDLEQGKAAVEFLTFSDRGGGFWTFDALSSESLREGRLTFELLPGFETTEMAESKQEKEARYRSILAKYRAAVAAVYGQMRFIGFPTAAAGNQPNVAVQELFVPLRFGRRMSFDFMPSLTTNDLLGELLSSTRTRPARFVVLGDPGSGKTTLCRFIAVYCTGELQQRGLPARVDLLPLVFPFRDYIRRRREQGDCEFLEYLSEQAHEQLAVGSLDRSILEEILESGSAVLLLDGLDEVGNSLERLEMRSRILDFCRRYEKISVMLTSRIAGYEDAPLPSNFFGHLELKPFEDQDLRKFVENWYQVQEPMDPQARERGIADLLAALGTEPRVRALASNPLLATLIALVHRTEAKLPGERAKLYELVVRTLLETWPALSKRRFGRIDEGLQRAYLEDFALAQQEKRSDPKAEVTFTRAVLVTSLTAIVSRYEQSSAAIELRRMVEDWVDYLAAGTGLIVEYRQGAFSFLHLSLLEFLAACALVRGAEALEAKILGLHTKAVWQEVFLLAIGRRATDQAFLEALSAKLGEEGWRFLLLCMREEAYFGDKRRDAILAKTANSLLRSPVTTWEEVGTVVQTIEKFSVRHAASVGAWRRTQLGSARGADLRGAVALSIADTNEVLNILEGRKDVAAAAADLLEPWPGPLGSWAVERAETPAMAATFADGPTDLVILRAIAGMKCKRATVALATAPAQLKAAAHFVGLAQSAAARLSKYGRPGGFGVPLQVRVPGATALKAVPRWPVATLQNEDKPTKVPRESDQYFAKSFIQGLTKGMAWAPVSDFDLAAMLAFVVGFEFDFTRHYANQFDRYFAHYFRSMLAGYIKQHMPGIFWGALKDHVELNFEDVVDVQWFPPDYAGPQAGPNSGAVGSSVVHEGLFNPSLRRFVETWIALVTTAESSREEAAAYLCARLQNVALLDLWPVMDRLLSKTPRPERLALYLQLGWTQSTTTHEWPATERWIALMKAGPPAHWLPRAQWHLCWLLHDPADTDHQQEFNEALREGLADPDLGKHAVAQTLEQVIGFY